MLHSVPHNWQREQWVNRWEWGWALCFMSRTFYSCCYNHWQPAWYFSVPPDDAPPFLDNMGLGVEFLWGGSMSSLCTGGHRPDFCPGSESKSYVLWGSHLRNLTISYLIHLKPTNSLLSKRTIWSLKNTHTLCFNLLSVFKHQSFFFKLSWR